MHYNLTRSTQQLLLLVFSAFLWSHSALAETPDSRCYPPAMLEDLSEPPYICVDFTYQALFEDRLYRAPKRLSFPVRNPPNANTWKEIGTNNYDEDYAMVSRTAGWATVAYTVQPDGRATDAVPMDSSHPRFVQSALSSATASRYKPGTLDDQPVPALSITTYYFNGYGPILGGGVHEKVVKQYDRFNKALTAKDEKKATRELNKVLRMKSSISQGSLTTVASIDYLFRSRYAAQWENKERQLAMLRKAVGYSTEAMFLSPKQHAQALLAMLELQYDLQHHADAIQTANAIQRQQLISQSLKTKAWNLSKQARTELKKHSPITWTATVSAEEPVVGATYRNRLNVEVIKGDVQVINARCQNGIYSNDPVSWTLPDDSGVCLIEVPAQKTATVEITIQ